jgi:hypothetical protein
MGEAFHGEATNMNTHRSYMDNYDLWNKLIANDKKIKDIPYNDLKLLITFAEGNDTVSELTGEILFAEKLARPEWKLEYEEADKERQRRIMAGEDEEMNRCLYPATKEDFFGSVQV